MQIIKIRQELNNRIDVDLNNSTTVHFFGVEDLSRFLSNNCKECDRPLQDALIAKFGKTEITLQDIIALENQ